MAQGGAPGMTNCASRSGSAPRAARLAVAVALVGALAGCATLERMNPLAGGVNVGAEADQSDTPPRRDPRDGPVSAGSSTIWDLFRSRGDAGTTLRVNRYLWIASLDVLSFLPVETVDPFSGVIVTGYGTPPGGSRAYRATIHVSDPALDARSLRVSLVGRDGAAVDAETLRALEDAILTRARQLRTRDAAL